MIGQTGSVCNTQAEGSERIRRWISDLPAPPNRLKVMKSFKVRYLNYLSFLHHQLDEIERDWKYVSDISPQ